MGQTFKEYMLTALPLWLRDTNGMDAVHQAIGDAKDSLVAREKDAVLARFTLSAPTDALAVAGVERQILRGAGELDADYAVRLQHAWDSWPTAGTPSGVLNALKYAGYTAALVQFRAYGYTLDANGNTVVTTLQNGGWRFDSTAAWARFAVLILPPFRSSWVVPGTPLITRACVGVGMQQIVYQSGTMNKDVRCVIACTAGGRPASVGTYFAVSFDGGVTFTTPTQYISSVIPLVTAATGVTLYLASNAMPTQAGDLLYVTAQSAVPVDGSPEALFVKSIVNKWKPVVTSVSKYIIQTNGFMQGWPVNKFVGTGLAGGTIPFRLGASTQVVWSP